MSSILLPMAFISLISTATARSIHISQISNQTNKDPLSCRLSEHCSNNENPSWSKFQMASDLGEIEVDKFINSIKDSNLTKYKANVAVIDTGFDSEQQLNGLQIYPRLIKGYDKAGSEYNDQNGHGTAVSGMISAKTVGVTRNINLDIFRLTGNHAGGASTSKLITDSIERACETSEIVNLSWGGYKDEQGAESPALEDWYQPAMDKGCLIVKSAGNSGFKSYEKYDLPIYAPVFLIASTNAQGEDSSFSSQGDVYAPGEEVYTLHSLYNTSISNDEEDKFCKVDNFWMKKINGTSFSSPAVAAILGQVLTILKVKNTIPDSPHGKIALLKNIILASARWSEQTGDRLNRVNSYLATLIAKHIEIDEIYSSIDELIEIGKREINASGICDEQFPKCNTMNECDEKIICIHENRKKMYLCDNLRSDSTIDLIESYKSMNESEMLSYMTSRSTIDLSGKTYLDDLLKKTWDLNFKEDNENNLALRNAPGALNLLELAIDKKYPEFVTADRLITIITESLSLEAFDFIHHDFISPIEQRSIDRRNELWRKYNVIPLKRKKEEQLFKIFSSMKLSEKIKFLQFFPKKRTKYETKFNVKNLAFLSMIIKNRKSLKKEEDKIITQLINQIITEMITELKTGEDVELFPGAMEAIIELRPSLLEELNINESKNLLEHNTRMMIIIIKNSKQLFNKTKMQIIDSYIDESIKKISYFQKQKFKSDISSRITQSRELKDFNEKLKIIFKVVFKTDIDFSKTIFLKLQKIMLSSIPFNTGYSPLNVMENHGNQYSKELFNDRFFMKKYIELIFKTANNVFSFELNNSDTLVQNLGDILSNNLPYLRTSYSLLNHIHHLKIENNLLLSLRKMVEIYENSRKYHDYKVIKEDIIPSWFARKFRNKKVVKATPIKIQRLVAEIDYVKIFVYKSIVETLKFISKTRGLNFDNDQKDHLSKSIQILKKELNRPDSEISDYAKDDLTKLIINEKL